MTWKKVFAWFPVEIDNKYIWLKTVYLKEEILEPRVSQFGSVDIFQIYQTRKEIRYGTIFDVLRDN